MASENETHLLKPCYASRGYAHVWLCKENRKVRAIVSRVIAETFIPNPDNKPQVDHIDTDKRNNCVDNLRWVTAKENSNNEITKKHFHLQNSGENARYFGKFGIAHNRSKAVVCINTSKLYGSTREAERLTGISHVGIGLCCNKKIKSAGKLQWQWADGTEAERLRQGAT